MLKRLSEHNKKNGDCIHDENQYLNLIQDILEHGDMVEGRNGFAKTVIGSAMHFSLENNTIPILTTKKVAWKTCLKELLWFIRGSTSNKELQAENVKIWNGNASSDFKKQIGIDYPNKDDLGPIYGHQWRYFNAPYKGCDEQYTGKGVDQIDMIIKSLQSPDLKYSRRLVMSAWNPCQLSEMVLPPCHILAQFSVNSADELSCAIYQRSGDIGLGIPFNIASYSFLTCILAKHCDLEPKKLVHFVGDAHIYESHINSLKEQLLLKPMNPPLFRINKRDNIDDYVMDDFSLNDYKHHRTIKMDMIA